MNANEVLANIALEMMGHKKGEYKYMDPHDQLNQSQSTNDSYPTAIKVAILLRNDKLIEEMQKLVASFRAKGNAFLKIVKMGRTEMQDAVPMTVGQEFHAFAAGLESEIKFLREAEKFLYAENMGATAIGTGINVPKGYPEKCAEHLAKIVGKPIVMAEDMLTDTWDQQAYVVYSSQSRRKTIKDFERSHSPHFGPWADLAINLPRPARFFHHAGKSELVIPEVMGIVAFRVMGNDVSVTPASHSGQRSLTPTSRRVLPSSNRRRCCIIRRYCSAQTASTGLPSTNACWRTIWKRPSGLSRR
jgi:aspartate ammonia-lyase